MKKEQKEVENGQEVNKEQEEEMKEEETDSAEGETAALQSNFFSHRQQTASVTSECIFHGLHQWC